MTGATRQRVGGVAATSPPIVARPSNGVHVYHLLTAQPPYDESIFLRQEVRFQKRKALRLRAQARELGFPVGSRAVCSLGDPASASPADEEFTMRAAPQPTMFQRMGKTCLPACLTSGVHRASIG